MRITTMFRSVVVALVTLMAVAAPIATAPAHAAEPCGSWRTIEAANGYRMYSVLGGAWMSAGGVSGVEDWNQLFLLCRNPAWASTDFAIRANAGGGYLRPYDGGEVIGVFNTGEATADDLWHWCDYDGNFSTFQHLMTKKFMGIDGFAPWVDVEANSSTLTGANLFKVSGGRPPKRCNT